MEWTKEKAIEDLERVESNLKVIILQVALNDMLGQSLTTRIMFNRVRPHVAEFCEWVLEHELIPEFGDLTVKQLLGAWGKVANVKPPELKATIPIIKEEIQKFKETHKEILNEGN